MGITVYVDGWHEQPSREVKVYQCEKYPSFTEEEFSGWGCQKDADGRHFEYERVYDNPFPSMDFSNGHWADFSRPLGLVTTDGMGMLEAHEVGAVLARGIRLLNSPQRQAGAARAATVSGRFICGGTPVDYIGRRASEFVQLLKFAVDRKKGVYWA